MKWIKFLGSVRFAVCLIGTFVLLLILSTSLESVYGTPYVQKLFYRAGWFDIFLSLLGVNIFCATLTRLPFKRKHTGFVITHFGILVLLTGCLMTRLFGVEGQMMLFEKEIRNRISQEGYQMHFMTPNRLHKVFDLKVPHKPHEPQSIPIPDTPYEIKLHQTLGNASRNLEIYEGGESDPTNHAIKIQLSSKLADFNESFWLIEKNPEEPHSDHLSLGPAMIRLKTPAMEENAVSPFLKITEKETQKVYEISVENTSKKIPFAQRRFFILDLNYYPNARVVDNKIVNASKEGVTNPAVAFKVADKEGHEVSYVEFALFPDFRDMHNKALEDTLGLNVEFIAPSIEESLESDGASLTFTVDNDNHWAFLSKSSPGKVANTAAIKEGDSFPTKWMDFNFEIKEMLNKAIVGWSVGTNITKGEDRIASEVHILQGDYASPKNWVVENYTTAFDTLAGPAQMMITEKSTNVPFYLQLKDFRKVDYPGTNNPVSYESDVVLKDPTRKVTIEKTISMNKPLDYDGYRIFQSSYLQDPALGEASIFTIAKNPGISLTYIGLCIILLGTLLIFYIKPLAPKDKDDS